MSLDCRTCGTDVSTEKALNIFAKEQYHIKEQIELLTGVLLPNTSGFPNSICKMCQLSLAHALNFRERCIATQLKFLKNLTTINAKLCEKKNTTNTDQQQLDENIIQIKDEPELSEDSEATIDAAESSFQIKTEIEDDAYAENATEQFLTQQEDSLDNALALNFKQPNVSNNLTNFQIINEAISDATDDDLLIPDHLPTQNDSNFDYNEVECIKEEIAEVQPNDINNKTSSEINTDALIQTVGAALASTSTATANKKTENKKKVIIFMCSDCGKYFLNRKTLLSHKKEHAAISDFYCAHCPNQYSFYEDLLEHGQDEKHTRCLRKCNRCLTTQSYDITKVNTESCQKCAEKNTPKEKNDGNLSETKKNEEILKRRSDTTIFSEQNIKRLKQDNEKLVFTKLDNNLTDIIEDLLHLKHNPKEFEKKFHMSLKKFQELYKLVVRHIGNTKNSMQHLITVMEYLATGDHRRLMLNTPNLGLVIFKICDAICKELEKDMPKWTAKYLEEVAVEFEKKCNFPNVIGAICAKQIIVSRTRNTSFILYAVSDASYKFTYIDIEACTSDTKANIFNNSIIAKSILTDSMDFPEDKDINGIKTPYFLIGDEVFPLCKRLMKPYSFKNSTAEKRVFNYRHGRARRCVDVALANLLCNWNCLQKMCFSSPSVVKKITKTCCYLYNFLLKSENDIEKATSGINITRILYNAQSLPTYTGDNCSNAEGIRDTLKDYVNSDEGSVLCQDKFIIG